jgi:wyosine [tRNA(Phe)-imidazoG37] synthetase (radical SAM superfamily)
MPGDGKICTFDCIYCECGFNGDHRPYLRRPTRKEVSTRLREILTQMASEGQHPDVLTFAGNGEPTAHPEFAGIICDTISLRDELAPQAKVSVLSNSTFIHLEEVREALMLVDNNILKLDTVDPDYIRHVDRPTSKHYDVNRIITDMEKFNGHIVIQSLFMKGVTNGFDTDNTGDRYVQPWLEALKRIRPREVMVYTIDRETPDHHLVKATHEELDHICAMVRDAGIPCTASY